MNFKRKRKISHTARKCHICGSQRRGTKHWKKFHKLADLQKLALQKGDIESL